MTQPGHYRRLGPSLGLGKLLWVALKFGIIAKSGTIPMYDALLEFAG